jgi:multidrug efflux pump subunit AcrB
MNFNKFFVHNYQFTLVLFIAVLILGLNALFNMPRSEDPPFGAPIFTVVAVYPGTSPSDMEELVADPIEAEIYKLADIKKINTTIKDGLMVMLVEFNFGVDVEARNNDVIREINKLRSTLPEGIISLDINKAASSDVAILQTALISETATMQEMKGFAETLEKDLERIRDIKWVEIQGAPEQKIRIEIDLDRMASYRIGLNQVIGLIQANNVNIPGGDIDIGKRKYNIKSSASFKTTEEIIQTVVNTNQEGRITRLKDIASIYISDEERDHITRFNGERAIWVVTAMKDKKNIIQVRKEMQQVLDKFSRSLPENIHIAHAFDQETGVKKRLAGLGKDFMIAILLVMLTLLPLGTRASMVVMISIPLSLSIGIFLLDLLGYTLNQLSIVGMVVALGLLVDDSIVVVENIERYMRKGISARAAAISATNHIMVAIIGCTMTLILAFLPLAHLPEGSGDFIRSLPMAVMLTVLASLFVSVTIIPFLSSILLRAHEEDSHNEGNFFFRSFKNYVNAPYQRLLSWCMSYPYKTLLSAALIFASSLLLIPVLGFSLFPVSEKPIVVVDITTEPGSNLNHTDRLIRKVEYVIMNNPEVQRISSNAGKGNPRIYYNEFQKQNAANVGQIIIYMDDNAKVPEIQAFSDKLRQQLDGFAGARIEVKRFQQGPPVTAPVEMRIIGSNLDTLEAISTRVESIMKNTEGTLYVKNDLKFKTTDINLKINRDKAGLYGISTGEVAKTIRLAMAGLDITELRTEDSDEMKVQISIARNTENALENFDRIHITSLGGELIPLNNLAKIVTTPAPPLILHYNKERYALVSCFTATGYNTDRVTDEILRRIENEIQLPEGYRLKAAGERESREESFGGIGTIIILTVFGLLGILILEFRTIKSTLIVLSVIPLGMVGALLALYFTEETLSFVATVGIIALAGIEIKNSILLVDYTNGLRAQGVPLYDAVMDGAETRFLPILLTALTAIGGLTPLFLERSPLISPLAIVIIGGLISSILMGRLVTPVLYYLLPPSINRD